MIGRGFLYTGMALILASALRSLADMLQADTFDPWSIALAVGCILASIGLGMTGVKPWEKIQETFERFLLSISRSGSLLNSGFPINSIHAAELRLHWRGYEV